MNSRGIIRIVTIGIALLGATISFAENVKFPTHLTISKVVNNTQYDLLQLNIAAYSRTSLPWEYDLPDRSFAIPFNSQVYEKGVHQPCLFNGGVNNFSKPYVNAGMAGENNCGVNVIVNQENETTYNIVLQPK